MLLHAGGGQDELVDLGLLGRVEVDEVGVWKGGHSNESLLQLPALPPFCMTGHCSTKWEMTFFSHEDD